MNTVSLNDLQPFFLTRNMIAKKKQTIRPYKLDTLFWCYFILKHGQSRYEYIQHTITIVVEKQYKITLVEELRSPELREKIKNCKLATIQHLEGVLANDNVIDLATFFTLCFIYDIQVFYFKDRCYYNSLPGRLDWIDNVDTSIDDDNDDGVFINSENTIEYEEETDYDFKTIKILKHNCGTKYYLVEKNILDIDWKHSYKISNLNKPLRAESYYTVADLRELANKFNLDHTGKKKKELYTLVQSFVKIDII